MTKGQRNQFHRTHAELLERFPQAFPSHRTLLPPLAVGIAAQLGEAMGWPPPQVQQFLRVWCRRPPYLAGVATALQRVNLDGSPAGDLDPAHKTGGVTGLKALAGAERTRKRNIAAAAYAARAKAAKARLPKPPKAKAAKAAKPAPAPQAPKPPRHQPWLQRRAPLVVEAVHRPRPPKPPPAPREVVQKGGLAYSAGGKLTLAPKERSA